MFCFWDAEFMAEPSETLFGINTDSAARLHLGATISLCTRKWIHCTLDSDYQMSLLCCHSPWLALKELHQLLLHLIQRQLSLLCHCYRLNQLLPTSLKMIQSSVLGIFPSLWTNIQQYVMSRGESCFGSELGRHILFWWVETLLGGSVQTGADRSCRLTSQGRGRKQRQDRK